MVTKILRFNMQLFLLCTHPTYVDSLMVIVSYFECSLGAGAAVLTAKHQKGLHS